MGLVKASQQSFVDTVNVNNLKIVVYGYGVIGNIVAPYFISENGLVGHTLFWADADPNKQDTEIVISGKRFVVKKPEDIKRIDEPFVVLITGSRYKSIIETFEKDSFYDDVDIYILPQMLADETDKFDCKFEIEPLTSRSIPKIIHYCWFGEKELPDELKRYMESWNKYCPDYEIRRWDENNYDVDKYIYSTSAYQHGKLGFVPDIVRLDLLYDYGGIYLDTDVELIRSLDDLLGLKGFIGTEKWGIVNAGGGSGAMPKHPMIGEMLEYKKGVAFERADGSLNLESSGTTESIPLLRHGFVPNNTLQTINGLTVLTSDFFQPYDYMTRKTHLTRNTYGIHHFYGSWL
jgi:hypothetical protein